METKAASVTMWLPLNMVDSNLVNETNLVQVSFLVYFVNFIYNLYMFQTSLGPKHVEVINKIDEIH